MGIMDASEVEEHLLSIGEPKVWATGMVDDFDAILSKDI